MNGVERRPDLLALAQPVEEFDREGTQIAALQGRLAFAKSGDDGVRIGLELFVSGAGIHQRARRKIMTARIVAAQFAVGGLPSAKRLGGRGNAGVDTKSVQQAVGGQGMQILPVGLHCDFARALAEADLLQWERDGVP